MADVKKIADWIKQNAPMGAHLLLDSRKVKQGDVFFAVKGRHTDGRNFIPKAIENGASCIVTEKGLGKPFSIPSFETEDLYRKLGPIGSEYFGNPTSKMFGVAITGTNGKTTTANWVAEIFYRLGINAGCIGTLGCTYNGEKVPSVPLTTPDPLTLQTIFEELYKRGGKTFAMEASSIGLVQGRMDGTTLQTAVFTNLTRDHLDYHGTMERYLEAKEILFAWPSVKTAVVNLSGEPAEKVIEVAKRSGKKVLTLSAEGSLAADLSASNIRHTHSGLSFEVHYQGKKYSVEANFLGLFNVENFLCAVGSVLTADLPFEAVMAEAVKLNPPAGRMQIVKEQIGPVVVVDYSHTPDAITKAIEALQDWAKVREGNIWILAGAGGDRDHGKRPLMAAAACAADEVILTSDNPRSEDPEEILKQMKTGLTRPAEVIVDRAEAIKYAVEHASPDDVILIAGKGHEDYQEIKGVKHHFSDVEQAWEALRKLRKEHE